MSSGWSADESRMRSRWSADESADGRQMVCGSFADQISAQPKPIVLKSKPKLKVSDKLKLVLKLKISGFDSAQPISSVSV
jgi:hypothetical protein